MPLPFRFDEATHVYTALDTGEELQHVTGMLARTGWIDDTWYTEEACERGTMVHQLTADYDLQALDVATLVSPWRPYLLGHVLAMQTVKPEILQVEVPVVHPRFRYGCRIDRVLRIYGGLGVLEVKTGAEPSRQYVGQPTAHSLQTALQALAAAEDFNLPAEAFTRWALYLAPNGKYKLRQHKDRADFDEAHKIIRRTC